MRNYDLEDKLENMGKVIKGNNRFFKGLATTVIGALVLLIGISSSVTKVHPGHAGIVYNVSGGLEETTLSQGWHIVAPWKSVREYPISTETVWLTQAKTEGSPNDDSYNTSTMEGKPVNVDAYFTYHVSVDKLPAIFNRFKGADIDSIQSGYLKQQVKTASQSITSSYSVLDLYGNKRTEIQDKIHQILIKELTPFGLEVETFSFGEIRPDGDTMKAIQAKVDAQQKLQQMEIELTQSTVTANKAKVDAQGIADATVIRATSEAKANQLLQQSLTPELVQKLWIDKWNGQQSQVVGGNNQMINVPAISK